MKEELQSMEDPNVYTLTELPAGAKCIGNRWVYKLKISPKKEVERFRARIVLKGYSQRKNIDYKELYALVCRFEVIRYILRIALRENLVSYQCDVKVAFLNSDIDVPLYMDQPEGFEENNDLVCFLIRAIYGARQSPRCFYKRMKTILSNLGLKQSSTDPCVFFGNKAHRLILALHVDDSVVVGKSEGVIISFLNELKHHLEMTYKPLEKFLGLQIERSERSLKTS